MSAITSRRLGLLGPADDDASPSARARALRIGAVIRRAVAGAGCDSVAVVAEGASSPLIVVRLDAEASQAELASVTQEVSEAIEADAELSRASTYRIVCQHGEETVGTLDLRVRADHSPTDVGLDLRRPHESMADALARQAMRHSEGLMRMFVEGEIRRSEAMARILDRQAQRLEVLEARASEQADRRASDLRAELELLERTSEITRRDRLQEEGLKLLGPAVPALVNRALKKYLPLDASTGAPQRAPEDKTAEKAPKKATSAKSSRKRKDLGGLALEALDALARQPRDAVAVVAGMMDPADGERVLAAYDARAEEVQASKAEAQKEAPPEE